MEMSGSASSNILLCTEASGLESEVGVAKSKDGVMVRGTLASTYVLHPSQTSMSLISN